MAKDQKIYLIVFILVSCILTVIIAYNVYYPKNKSIEHSEEISSPSNTCEIELVENFYSPELDNYKTLRIYLPNDYNNSLKEYPVIYMQDGQNLFDTRTASYQKEWHVDETLQSLYENNKSSGVIIVGIDSFEMTRTDEYNPFSESTSAGPTGSKEGGGKGDKYSDFLVKTLKPYIDENYRTLKDKQNTAIIGSSYGGVISLYTGIKYNNTFGMIGSFSFCNNVNRDAMVSYLKDNFNKDVVKDSIIYMYCGTSDFAYSDAKEAYNIGVNNGISSITFDEDNGIHDESSWSDNFENCLKFLKLSK